MYFLDLDGVLVDWDKGYKELSGKVPASFEDVSWKLVDSAGVGWWENLSWMPDGKELWQALKGLNPTILSAPSRHENSRKGKRLWVKRELGSEVPLILENKKEKYAGPNKILIDDRIKNISKWEENGGIGILHKNTDSTLKALSDIVVQDRTPTVG